MGPRPMGANLCHRLAGVAVFVFGKVHVAGGIGSDSQIPPVTPYSSGTRNRKVRMLGSSGRDLAGERWGRGP